MVKNGKIGGCLIQSIKKETEAQDMNNCTHSFTHSHTHTVLIGVLFLLQDKENGNSTAKSEYTISAKNKLKKNPT